MHAARVESFTVSVDDSVPKFESNETHGGEKQIIYTCPCALGFAQLASTGNAVALLLMILSDFGCSEMFFVPSLTCSPSSNMCLCGCRDLA